VLEAEDVRLAFGAVDQVSRLPGPLGAGTQDVAVDAAALTTAAAIPSPEAQEPVPVFIYTA